MDAVVVVALLVVFDVLVYFWGCDSRDGLRSDQYLRFANWIESTTQRRDAVLNAIAAPAQHVGWFLREGRVHSIEPRAGTEPAIGRGYRSTSAETDGPALRPVLG